MLSWVNQWFKKAPALKKRSQAPIQTAAIERLDGEAFIKQNPRMAEYPKNMLGYGHFLKHRITNDRGKVIPLHRYWGENLHQYLNQIRIQSTKTIDSIVALLRIADSNWKSYEENFNNLFNTLFSQRTIIIADKNAENLPSIKMGTLFNKTTGLYQLLTPENDLLGYFMRSKEGWLRVMVCRDVEIIHNWSDWKNDTVFIDSLHHIDYAFALGPFQGFDSEARLFIRAQSLSMKGDAFSASKLGIFCSKEVLLAAPLNIRQEAVVDAGALQITSEIHCQNFYGLSEEFHHHGSLTAETLQQISLIAIQEAQSLLVSTKQLSLLMGSCFWSGIIQAQKLDAYLHEAIWQSAQFKVHESTLTCQHSLRINGASFDYTKVTLNSPTVAINQELIIQFQHLGLNKLPSFTLDAQWEIKLEGDLSLQNTCLYINTSVFTFKGSLCDRSFLKEPVVQICTVNTENQGEMYVRNLLVQTETYTQTGNLFSSGKTALSATHFNLLENARVESHTHIIHAPTVISSARSQIKVSFLSIKANHIKLSGNIAAQHLSADAHQIFLDESIISGKQQYVAHSFKTNKTTLTGEISILANLMQRLDQTYGTVKSDGLISARAGISLPYGLSFSGELTLPLILSWAVSMGLLFMPTVRPAFVAMQLLASLYGASKTFTQELIQLHQQLYVYAPKQIQESSTNLRHFYALKKAFLTIVLGGYSAYSLHNVLNTLHPNSLSLKTLFQFNRQHIPYYLVRMALITMGSLSACLSSNQESNELVALGLGLELTLGMSKKNHLLSFFSGERTAVYSEDTIFCSAKFAETFTLLGSSEKGVLAGDFGHAYSFGFAQNQFWTTILGPFTRTRTSYEGSHLYTLKSIQFNDSTIKVNEWKGNANNTVTASSCQIQVQHAELGPKAIFIDSSVNMESLTIVPKTSTEGLQVVNSDVDIKYLSLPKNSPWLLAIDCSHFKVGNPIVLRKNQKVSGRGSDVEFDTLRYQGGQANWFDSKVVYNKESGREAESPHLPFMHQKKPYIPLYSRQEPQSLTLHNSYYGHDKNAKMPTQSMQYLGVDKNGGIVYQVKKNKTLPLDIRSIIPITYQFQTPVTIQYIHFNCQLSLLSSEPITFYIADIQGPQNQPLTVYSKKNVSIKHSNITCGSDSYFGSDAHLEIVASHITGNTSKTISFYGKKGIKGWASVDTYTSTKKKKLGLVKKKRTTSTVTNNHIEAGKIHFSSPEGGVHMQGTDCLGTQQIFVYAKKNIIFSGTIVQDKSHDDTFIAHSRTTNEQNISSNWLAPTILLISEKENVVISGTNIIGGYVGIKAKKVRVENVILVHTEKSSGFDLNGSLGPFSVSSPKKPQPAEIEPFIGCVSQLKHAHGLNLPLAFVELVARGVNLLAEWNLSARATRFLMHHYPLSPTLNIRVSHHRSMSTHTSGNFLLAQNLNIIAPEGVQFGNGIFVQAEQSHIETPFLEVSGAHLTQQTSSISASLTLSPGYIVGGDLSMHRVSGSYIQPSVISLGNFSGDIQQVRIENSQVTMQQATGRIGEVHIQRNPFTLSYKGMGVAFTAPGIPAVFVYNKWIKDSGMTGFYILGEDPTLELGPVTLNGQLIPVTRQLPKPTKNRLQGWSIRISGPIGSQKSFAPISFYSFSIQIGSHDLTGNVPLIHWDHPYLVAKAAKPAPLEMNLTAGNSPKKALKNKNKSAASQKKKTKSKKIVRKKKSRLRDNPEIVSGNSWTIAPDGSLEITMTVPPGIQMRDIFHSFLRGIWHGLTDPMQTTFHLVKDLLVLSRYYEQKAIIKALHFTPSLQFIYLCSHSPLSEQEVAQANARLKHRLQSIVALERFISNGVESGLGLYLWSNSPLVIARSPPTYIQEELRENQQIVQNIVDDFVALQPLEQFESLVSLTTSAVITPIMTAKMGDGILALNNKRRFGSYQSPTLFHTTNRQTGTVFDIAVLNTEASPLEIAESFFEITGLTNKEDAFGRVYLLNNETGSYYIIVEENGIHVQSIQDPELATTLREQIDTNGLTEKTAQSLLEHVHEQFPKFSGYEETFPLLKEPISTIDIKAIIADKKSGQYIYIVTKEGQLRIAEPYFHHDFLGEGQEVVAAGELTFVEGELISANSQSGSYVPQVNEGTMYHVFVKNGIPPDQALRFNNYYSKDARVYQISIHHQEVSNTPSCTLGLVASAQVRHPFSFFAPVKPPSRSTFSVLDIPTPDLANQDHPDEKEHIQAGLLLKRPAV